MSLSPQSGGNAPIQEPEQSDGDRSGLPLSGRLISEKPRVESQAGGGGAARQPVHLKVEAGRRGRPYRQAQNSEVGDQESPSADLLRKDLSKGKLCDGGALEKIETVLCGDFAKEASGQL